MLDNQLTHLIYAVSDLLGLNALVVEKDYYMTRVIQNTIQNLKIFNLLN